KTDLLLLRTYPLLAKVVIRYGLNEDPGFLEADNPRTVMEAAKAIFTKFTGSAIEEDAAAQPTLDPPPQIDGALSPEDIKRLTPYITKLDGSLYVSKIEETQAIQIGFTHSDPVIAEKIANGMAQTFLD